MKNVCDKIVLTKPSKGALSMKRSTKCILCFAFLCLLLFFSVKTHAESESGYFISQNGSEYLLHFYDGVNMSFISSSADISELLYQTSGELVTLENLNITSPVILDTGKHKIKGSATFKSSLVISGNASITIEDGILNFEDEGSYINIKGGELNFLGGKINSEYTAIISDYSARSALNLISCEVASLKSPAISLKEGAAVIYGGKISSAEEAAIENSATLSLSGKSEIDGVGYDIITDMPISLSSKNEYFGGELRLKYLSKFEKGSMSEVFRECNANSLQNISLFDINDSEIEVMFFESSTHIFEKNFGAVYLPYTLKLIDDGKTVGIYNFLDGESAEIIEAPRKDGYIFSAFYNDEDKKREFSKSEIMSGDRNIYLSYRLEDIKFSLSSMNFTYDGKEHMLDFEIISHTLSDYGRFEFEWFKNGNSIGTFDGGVALKNVSDSGEYSCKVTFYCGKDMISTITPAVNASIYKQLVDIPIATPKNYNGNIQYSGLMNTEFYTVSDYGGTNAGLYSVKLSLRFPENYAFKNTQNPYTEVCFEIKKAENFWTSSLVSNDIYEGFAPMCKAYSAFGNVYFLYFTEENSEYTENPPKSVNTYYVKAVVDETENYSGLISEAVAFRVLEEKVIGLSVESLPKKTEYRAFDAFDKSGLAVSARYNSGRQESLSLDSLKIKYQSAENLRYGDTAVNILFEACEASIPLTVKKIEYDMSGISFENKTIVYDGEYHTLAYNGELPMGKDGICLQANTVSGGMNVGKYEITLNFQTESQNYILPENQKAVLEIIPMEVTVEWENTVFVYDGGKKVPSAYFTDVFGKKTELRVNGSISGAAENAIATVSPPTANYIFKNPQISFTVKKADYSFEEVKWIYSELTYNGNAQSVILSGLPNGITVIGYTDNSKVDAGKYKASALLSYDERNYNPPPILTLEWEIKKAEYDMKNVLFNDASYVYDGNIHFPSFDGEMPIGVDGLALEYEFSRGVTHVSEGKCQVDIIFSTKSKNYISPKNITVYVEITPMPISVIWEYSNGVYNGKEHIPTAKSEYCDINVFGGEISAGRYTAKAEASVSDYIILNDTYEFLIAKAENFWITEPESANIFEGENPSPKAEANEGEVVFKYYSDPEMKNEASLPLTYGEYYMCAVVPETLNYHAMVSQPVKFTVIQVLPVDIDVSLNRYVFSAFEAITSEDLKVFVHYNNGEIEELLLENVSISYQNADNLRYLDEYIIVSYSGIEKTVNVTVNKAQYDMSRVSWENTEQIYDGGEKTPSLIGLPSGIEVRAYIGGGIAAGEYLVNAEFEFDFHNYEMPEIDDCIFIIKKQRVELPVIASVVYDAKEHTPTSASQLYSFESAAFKDAGKYNIRAVLNDSENYIFENETSAAVIEFTIEKKQLTIDVGDIILYLDTDLYMPSHKLCDMPYDGDSLELYYEVIGDDVYIKTKNSNYEILSLKGSLIRENRLSPDSVSDIIIAGVLLLILLLIALCLYIYRHKLFHIAAAWKCRRKFAKEKNIAPIAILPPFIPIVKTKEESEENAKSLSEIELDNEWIMSVDVDHADSLITDSLAKNLIKKERGIIYTEGCRKNVINVDVLSDNFSAGERVDVNSLKEHKLIPSDTAYIKVLARGSIDKPLSVHANAFSLSAVKMIALTGGEAVKVNTVKIKQKKIGDDFENSLENPIDI